MSQAQVLAEVCASAGKNVRPHFVSGRPRTPRRPWRVPTNPSRGGLVPRVTRSPADPSLIATQPDEHELRKGGKAADASLPWRLLRLTNNTTLDMIKRRVRAGGAVATATLAVSLPSGQRVTVQPSLETTVGSVLAGLASLGHITAGTNFSLASVLVLRRTVTAEELDTTTLRGKRRPVSARSLRALPRTSGRSGCGVYTGTASRVHASPPQGGPNRQADPCGARAA